MRNNVAYLFPLSQEEVLKQNYNDAARAILGNEWSAPLEIPGLLSSNILAEMNGLARFNRTVPLEEQERWKVWVPRNPKYDEPDDGAIRKKPPNDWKLFFHYRSDLEELLFQHNGITLSSWQKAWFRSLGHTLDVCNGALQAFAEELDYVQPGFNFKERAGRERHLNVVRVLQYEPRPGTLAKIHTDRTALTFTLGESTPGLHFSRGLETKAVSCPQAPQTLLFPGDHFEMITRGAVARTYHLVHDQTNGATIRSSVVFFGSFYTGEL